MSAFTNGFNIGFVNGMFNRMFGNCNMFAGFNPFCNFNIFGGFNFMPMPMSFTPMMNASIFSQWQTPVYSNWNMTNYTQPSAPIQTPIQPAIDTNAGWKAATISNINIDTGFDTFVFTTKNSQPSNETGTSKSNSSNKSSVSKNKVANKTKTTTPTKAKTYREMTDAQMRSVYGNYTRNVTQLYTGTAEDLNKYLKNKGVLAGKGQAFIDAQKKYGISASVLAGISMNESARGTSNLARTKNNIGGIRMPGSKQFKTFPSVEACIDEMAGLLKRRYINENLVCLYQINAKYCPVQDPTDDGNNNGWAAAVNRYANEIEKG